MKRLAVLFVICVAFAMPAIAQVKFDFVQSIDIGQLVARPTGEARWGSGAHFTLFRVGDFHFGGVGAGVDIFMSDGTLKLNPQTTTSMGAAPYISIPIIAVWDTQTSFKPVPVGLLINWIYDTKLKDNSLGFGITYPLRFHRKR